jgi:hypothetical protein
VPGNRDSLVQPSGQRQRELLDRYAAAFEDAGVAGLVTAWTEDAAFACRRCGMGQGITAVSVLA